MGRSKECGKKIVLSALALALSANIGCISKQKLDDRVIGIKQEHGVTVKADNPLLRSLILHNTLAYLTKVDDVLDDCHENFKTYANIIHLDDNFLFNRHIRSNPLVWPLALMVRGYVDDKDSPDFPAHLKDPSLPERAFFYAPFQKTDREVILEELTHSYTAKREKDDPNELKKFYDDLESVRKKHYGGALSALAYMATGVRDFYKNSNIHEYIAEIHILLWKNDYNVDYLKENHPKLHEECEIVKKFVTGGYLQDKTDKEQQAKK